MQTMKELLSLCKRPALWERSGEQMWDDAHISKGMLEAHLNPHWDAASRKHDFIDRSVLWLHHILPDGGSILDLGCGPGLYAKRLSGLGYRMTGVDLSRRSIAYAKGQDHQSEYILGNYLDMTYENCFDAVLLIYCDYAALTAPERQTLLGKVLRALKPGGLFVFDVFTPCADGWAGAKEERTWTRHENGGFWSDQPHVHMSARYVFLNNTVEASRNLIITEAGVREYMIWNAVFTADALLAEIAGTGFRVRQLVGDLCGAAYAEASETLCVVLQKQT
jgi:SAM-dependent methyltransferase